MLAQHLLSTSHHAVECGNVPSVQCPCRWDGGKRAFDFGVAITISIVAIPIIAAAWFIVRMTSSGPGFYSQVRVGRKGRHYRIYKIRTMFNNCEASTGAAWSTKSDKRVTPIGRVLRKLHIDELPQLLNVLRGDMSLVGPRPERPEFVGPLSVAIPGYTDRLAVRPGVTGLAQIQLPPDTEVESVRRKLVLDRCYASSATLWLDSRILFGTLLYLVGFSYATVRNLVRLPNPLENSVSGDAREKLVSPGITERFDSGSKSAPTGTATVIPCGEVQ